MKFFIFHLSRFASGKKRLSVNDIYAEASRRGSVQSVVINDREKSSSRNHSRRPSLSDSGNGLSLSSSLNHTPSYTSESGHSSPRRRSSFSIDQDAARREGVISYTPQMKTVPVAGESVLRFCFFTNLLNPSLIYSLTYLLTYSITLPNHLLTYLLTYLIT